MKFTLGILHLLISLALLTACGTSRNSENKDEAAIVNMNPIVLEGAYQGKNLYVQNPMTQDGWCAVYVEVNGVKVLDSLDVQKTAFEIDLKSLGIEQGGAVQIRIYHQSDCMPKVLNPEVH